MRLIRKYYLWMIPVCFVVFYCGYTKWQGSGEVAPEVIQLMILLSLLVPAILVINDMRYPSPDEDSSYKKRARYRNPPKDLLGTEPAGIVFGKTRSGQYVQIADADPQTHILVIGGSGSGKSSGLVIPNLMLAQQQGLTVFVIDIKGELSEKTVPMNAEYSGKVAIIAPGDRRQWGFQPMYLLNKDSSQQEILETMQTIAFSLISISESLSDKFWKQSARNLLIGLMVYEYNQGRHDFIQIIDAILEQDIANLVKEALKKVAVTSNEYRYLIQFADLAQDTMTGIVVETMSHLMLFGTDQDIRYFLRNNPRKANPAILSEGVSEFLVIKENKLAAYYDLVQLILNETMEYLETLPENSPNKILVAIDELPRLVSSGKIEHLSDAVRTLRSKSVICMLITQSLEALESAYKQSEVEDLASNCGYKIILSASSKRTQDTIIAWSGTYKELRRSVSDGRNKSITRSFEDKDIVTPEELVALPQKEELILISPYGYNRLCQVRYYKDPYFADTAARIAREKTAIAEIEDKAKTCNY